MSAKYILLLITVFILMAGVSAEVPDNLTIITENYPPLSYLDDGTLKGISVDLVIDAMAQIDPGFNSSSITILPWSEGYAYALNQSDTLLFSTARLDSRENLFQWAGPLISDRKVLFGSTGKKIGKAEIEALRIIVVTDDSGEVFALKAGANPSRMMYVSNAQQAIEALENGKADLFAYGELAGKKAIEQYASVPSSIDVLYSLGNSDSYIAANINTSTEFVETLNTTLQELRTDTAGAGVSPYEKILGKYLSIQCVETALSPEQVTTLVSRTAQEMHKNSTTTLAAIKSGEAPYKDPKYEDLYVFVYDMNATLIADAGNPQLIGMNMHGKGDVNGKMFRDDIIAKAKRDGSGWTDYVYSNPSMTGLYKKTAYGMLITGSDGEQYVVAAGRFLPCVGE